MKQEKLILLNVGCGSRYHTDWVNIDFVQTGPGVISHDLRNGIPSESNTFDVVYHSHILEHFSKNAANDFMKDCFRVLKPGGVIRCVVPDLETIVRLYLKSLEGAIAGDRQAQDRYNWMMIEMFDQTVRNYSGGCMLEYWKQNPMPEEEFVVQRMGTEVKTVLSALRTQVQPQFPGHKKEVLDPLEIGTFRLSGEIHQWMYDRYSLSKLMEQVGFKDICVCSADESRIKDFNSYLLDIEADGSVRKPDSLFMEAVKR